MSGFVFSVIMALFDWLGTSAFRIDKFFMNWLLFGGIMTVIMRKNFLKNRNNNNIKIPLTERDFLFKNEI